MLEATQHEIILHHVIIKNREERDQFQLDTLDGQFQFLRKKLEIFKDELAHEIPFETKRVGLDRSTCLFFGARSCTAMDNQVSAVFTGCIELKFGTV